jgi:DNA-binding CsgD family transcriptional regulator
VSLVLRVFIEAATADARQRLTAEATRAGWRVVGRRSEADVVLAEAGAEDWLDQPDRAGSADDSRRGAREVIDDDGPREVLTPREQEVLALLAEGAGNREIAQRLGVTEHTVKFHLGAIFGKLGASTRTEAVRRALRWGWIDL